MEAPTPWSLSKNPPISNYGTIVDKRLTTVSPTNKDGYVPLDPNSKDPIVKNTSIAIDTNGRVTYQYTDVAGISAQYNNIQEIADIGKTGQSIGYTSATTARLKDATQSTLTQRTNDIIVNQTTAASPYAKVDPNSQGQGNTSASEFNQDKLNASISDATVRDKYENLQYPLKAKFMESQDCIKFSMYRYTPKKFGVTENLGGFSGSVRDDKKPLGTVMLPIQPTISDSNGVQWGSTDNMNAVQALVGAAALAGIQKGAGGIGETADQILTALKNKSTSSDITTGLAAYFAGEAAGANSGFLTRATGAVLNNNLELLFQGPSLRSFTFNFSLSAREPDEAIQIKKIIRFFKQGMSVKRSSTALFLKSPNVFDIQYYNKDKEHPWINKIKTCALQTCSVNYTPAGNYATFEDGAMTQYDITLSFGEIEPLFDDDYDTADKDIGGGLDSSIGY